MLNGPTGSNILKERHMSDRKCHLYGKTIWPNSFTVLLNFIFRVKMITCSMFDVSFAVNRFNRLPFYKM